MMHVNSTSSQAISRRAFLALSGLGVAGLLTACGTSSAHTVKPTPTPAVSPTRQVALTEADWSALGRDLQGTLIQPGNPQYAVAHQLFNTRFDNIAPAGVAYCASPADVQACLAFVRRFNLPVTVRSGGHSYAGYSTTSGLMLDVTRMNSVSLDTGTGAATIGGGAHLIDVYAALAQDGVVIPAGSCPTVGIAGLTLGGGVGVLGRKFGLTCDNLLSAQVVLADGTILTCNQNAHSDLFWALQGGGGGNFGVVTSFTFQAHPLQSLSLFTLDWQWKDAAAVLGAWQRWAPPAPDELWSNFLLLTTADKSTDPIVRVNGTYVGSVNQLNVLLGQLLNAAGAVPASRYVWSDTVLSAMLYEAGCYNRSVNACHLPSQNPQGQLQRAMDVAKSDYVTKVLPAQGISALVNAIAQRQTSPVPGGGGIGIDAYGGAINRVAANATAFVHRSALFSIQYTTAWPAGASQAVIAQNRAWLTNTWQAMRPYASGEAYQNYIDPDLANWLQAYYGANLARLQHIKATYDPGNLFHFAQSIPPA